MSEGTVTREKHDPAAGASWRSSYAAGQTIQRVRPAEETGYLANPHRGTATFQRFSGDALNPGLEWSEHGPVEFKAFDGNLSTARYPNTTVSYCRWVWSVLEPEKGHFRWEIVDGALKAARVRGQTLQVRIQPYVHDDMPKWYWELGGRKLPPKRIEADGSLFSPASAVELQDPDHNDPKYLKHFGEILRAFGKRYDGHPDLESFDMAYGGGCGEGGGNSTPATARKLIEVYLKSFKKTHLVSMLGTHGCRHASKLARVGWRADCFGDLNPRGLGHVPDGLNWNHMYDYYPAQVHECGLSERWKTAPVTLETCWTVGFWAKHGWNVDWILAQGLKYHTSFFMPKSCFIPEEWREKVDAFDRKLGYRFVLRQAMLPLEAKPGARIAFNLWMENVGVAPIYREYRLAFRFRQGNTSAVVPVKADPCAWLPGDAVVSGQISLPKSLKRGTADVDLGLIEPKTGTARVLFANKPRREDRWLALTKMDVV